MRDRPGRKVAAASLVALALSALAPQISAVPATSPKAAGAVGPSPTLKPLGEVLLAIDEHFKGRKGLVRIEAGELVVPIRDVTPRDHRVVESLSTQLDTRVRAEPLHGLTANELERLRSRLSRVLQADGPDNWGVGILGRTGTVYVSLPAREGSRTRTLLLAETASFVHDLRDSSQAQGDLDVDEVVLIVNGVNSDTELRDNSPQGGGKWITVGGGGLCTLGYMVRNQFGDMRGMSAGHCSGVGVLGDSIEDANLDGSTDHEQYGVVAFNWYANNQPDVMTWPVSDWDGHTRVYLGNGWKLLSGVTNESQQVMGLTVCGTGWGIQSVDQANQKCGDLAILDYDFTDRGVTTPNTNCFERRTRPGDSGGPTYALDAQSRALATGITKGSHRTWFLWWSSYYWCYVTIDDALAVGSYTLPVGS